MQFREYFGELMVRFDAYIGWAEVDGASIKYKQDI